MFLVGKKDVRKTSRETREFKDTKGWAFSVVLKNDVCSRPSRRCGRLGFHNGARCDVMPMAWKIT